MAEILVTYLVGARHVMPSSKYASGWNEMTSWRFFVNANGSKTRPYATCRDLSDMFSVGDGLRPSRRRANKFYKHKNKYEFISLTKGDE